MFWKSYSNCIQGAVNKYKGLMTELTEKYCNEYTDDYASGLRSEQTFYDKDERTQKTVF